MDLVYAGLKWRQQFFILCSHEEAIIPSTLVSRQGYLVWQVQMILIKHLKHLDTSALFRLDTSELLS